MRICRVAGAVACLLLAVGCGSADGTPDVIAENSAEEHLDVAPATLEKGASELARANELIAKGADKTRIMAEVAQLSQHLDKLNGLVDSVEVGPNHTVSFYSSAGGTVLGERAPKGTPSAFTGLDLTTMSAVELHLKLAPQQEVPSALLKSETATNQPILQKGDAPSTPLAGYDAPAAAGGTPQTAVAQSDIHTSEISAKQEELTSADGPFFVNNFCHNFGVFHTCAPNYNGHYWAYSNATHSDVVVAPYGSGVTSTSWTLNNVLMGTWANFAGDILTLQAISGRHSVSDGCCFICACGTHLETYWLQHRWDTTGTGFHFSAWFYNNPKNINYM